jgi:hypothetical protein
VKKIAATTTVKLKQTATTKDKPQPTAKKTTASATAKSNFTAVQIKTKAQPPAKRIPPPPFKSIIQTRGLKRLTEEAASKAKKQKIS